MTSSVPEGWEFLHQIPEEWQAPPELLQPPKSSAMNLILQIVTSEFASNDILEASGRLLSAYAALNGWLATAGSKRLGFEGVTRVSAEISFVVRDIYAAWVAFLEAFAPTSRVGVADEERRMLVLAIREGASRLDALRHPVD